MPNASRILAESETNWVSLAIFADDITRAYFAPDEAYAMARCLEWLGEPGEVPAPNNIMPPTAGVLLSQTDLGRVTHVVISDEDDERAGSIVLDPSRAAMLADQLYKAAVEAVFYGGSETGGN